MHIDVRFGPSQLKLPWYMYLSGRALCLECRVSWVRVPPEAAHCFLRKSDCLGCAVLLCLVVCLLLSSFSHLSLKHVLYMFIHVYVHTCIYIFFAIRIIKCTCIYIACR